MLRKRLVFLILTLVNVGKPINGGGTMKIALETYRFEVSLNPDDGESLVTSDPDILADIDYVKDYSPTWKLKTSLDQDYENSTSSILSEMAFSYWPWDGPTNCVSPVKFKFLLCLDYAQEYDPTRKCQLGRVQSQLMDVSRDRFSAAILGRKTINFGSLMRVLDDGDIITNPMGFDFEEWKGPLRLSVFVSCCGGSRFITDRCEDELTTTLRIRPQSLVGGIQAMRYAVDGKGSLTFSVNANCEKEHYGRSCDVYCKIDKPALEHAMCNSSTGERQCMPGWQGTDCQMDVDECQGLMCKNGGTCQNIRGAYSCICPFGTRGRRCQNRYPVCHLKPCQHQGTCLETTAGALCFCMPGFDGQWCHLLEDDAETSRKVTGQGSRSHDNDSQFDTPTPVRTVLLRDNKEENQETSSKWHDWYLAIIFGVFILIVLLIVLLFLLYRAKVRQQYKVTIPESTLLPVQPLPKTRVFDNAVYERDDDSGIIQPNTFQIFYESKNIVDILNNTNNNHINSSNHHHHHLHQNNNNNTITNDIGKARNKSKVDNNKGMLLNASALMHAKPETSRGGKDKKQDYNAKAKVKLPTGVSSSRSPKVENKSKSRGSGKRKADAYDDKDIRPYSVETIERGGIDVRKKQNPRNKKPPIPQNDPTDFYNIPTQSNKSPIIDRWKHVGNIYPSPKTPKSAKFGYPGSSYQSEYKEPKSPTRAADGEPVRGNNWRKGHGYIPHGSADIPASTRHRDPHRKRKSELTNSHEIEHEYEDIESDNGFLRYRPTPKPRSVHNVQCETLKRRYAVPDGMPEPESSEGEYNEIERKENSRPTNQSYHYYRRSSDGLLGEHISGQQHQHQHRGLELQPHQQTSNPMRAPPPPPPSLPPAPTAASKNRFDQPRFSEGDIVYPKPRPIHKHYCSQYDLKRKPLSLYVSPEDMTLMSNKNSTMKNGGGQIPGYTNTANDYQVNPPIMKSPSRTNTSSKNPYSEPRNSNSEDGNFFRGKDGNNSMNYLAKPKQSPTTTTATSPRGSGRFDFFGRPQSRHIYRNTDMEGFDGGRYSPKQPRSPSGWGRPKSGDFGSSSFRRKSLVNLSSSPKADRRRRKSEVMSDKLFRSKKLTSELRSDSEASVDKCWWMQEDDPFDTPDVAATRGDNNNSTPLPSSAFV